MIIISFYGDAMNKDYYRAIIKGVVAGCDGTMIQDTLDTFQQSYTASLLVLNTEIRSSYIDTYLDNTDKLGNCIIEWDYVDNVRVLCEGKLVEYYNSIDGTDIQTIINTALQYTSEDTITIGEHVG